ncbi:monovalent cation/H+ antiporter subunit D family protein [Thiohalorhabdus methylotrophus]|uniref:Monovalent cation/H+ antiporter subunit D family protein n=1 Tax=Thiohalorhabdus methylotrophus TaxID=3242694 RepID=A0ABV4TRZ1_9GAMM
MIAHLPILQVVAPLIAAPACMLLRWARLAWLLATGVTWASLGIAALLARRVMSEGPVSYAIGGWLAPWGIEYRIDALNVLVLLIVTGIGAVVMPFARASVEREIPRDRIPLFYVAYLLCLAGLLGITVTGDAFNLFVFLEISSLSSYILIAQGSDRRALTAAYRYLIMGTIGATFILIGVGFLYMMTGTLNMQDLAARLQAVEDTRTVRAGFAFLTVGISLKLALFPLHLWLPNAYTYAPSAVSAFLAATATKVAVYMFVRFLFTVFGVDFAFGDLPLEWVLMGLALAAIFSASAVAIFQEDVRRMLAYSSVAQIGYMILGVSFATVAGLTAGMTHLFNHALMKGALFLAVGAVAYRLGSTRIDDLAGLGRRMPWTFGALVIGGISLIGLPPTAGFISKWYLVAAALELGWWPVAVLILLGSLLALVYMGRIVEAAYFREPPAGSDQRHEAPPGLLVPTWTLVAANLYFGLDTRLNVGLSREAALALFGGAG